ncbi:MAG: YigZ family protein [Sediminimonas qiaohouensis]|uniref:YigZ family protein n=1 Tax=Sediminimonas qiaohouensis TaxID=552061 RepID=A0A7C9LPX6_9RHOB|nr:YigZ family protein [Sediminimonas qiaohouensis]MTJ03136.1 YigZ family protein [Sediminimonas qiaohouensis]
MKTIENVVNDRGSRYAVSGGAARSDADVTAFLKQLKRNKKYAKATHNTWAVLAADGTARKGDDGESGAGMVILRMLERAGLHDHVIVVTRWYGGKHLGGDRFRHVQTCVRRYLEAIGRSAAD